MTIKTSFIVKLVLHEHRKTGNSQKIRLLQPQIHTNVFPVKKCPK